MTIVITADEARELLTRAVEEKGADYVYPRSDRLSEAGCVYFEGDAPSCIVGHVLAYKGMEPLGDSPDNAATVYGLIGAELLAADETTARALWTAQDEQDSGGTWGEALAIGLRVLDRTQS